MDTPLQRAAVIGAGAMGSLCAALLGRRGVGVRLWARRGEQVESLRSERCNSRYLPELELPESVEVTGSFAEAVSDAEWIISAVPCQYIRAVWSANAKERGVGVPIVSVAKGIEAGTLERPSQILAAFSGGASVAALSGPSLAGEIAQGLPATVVVAGDDTQLTESVQRTLSGPALRIYTGGDVVGVEICGAAKNVIAIAAGIGDGLSMGDNAKASLLTRGLVEITRLGLSLGARAETFGGLAGIGDLVATCGSGLSRNHTAGVRIGHGDRLEQVLEASAGVVEGVETTRSILQLAERSGVEMPITRAVYRVLFDRQSPRDAVDELMTRRLRAE